MIVDGSPPLVNRQQECQRFLKALPLLQRLGFLGAALTRRSQGTPGSRLQSGTLAIAYNPQEGCKNFGQIQKQLQK